MTTEPVVTVIVCTRNPGVRIRQTVSSILASTEPRFVLLVVDQSDDDQVPRALGELLADQRVRHLTCAARGLSAARNVGAEAATTDWLAFTDDDCVVTTAWLAEIVAPLAGDERIAVVFGTVRPAPYDPALGFLPNYSRREPLLARSIFDKHEVEGIGASMAVRRSAWVALNGFDPMLGAGGPMHSAEETDFVMRALLSGYFASETPGAAVIHSGFRTWPEAPRVLGQYLHGIGASLAKLARLGHWQVAVVAARLAVRWMVARPVVDMGAEAHRRARLLGFLAGVRAGLSAPLDRQRGLFHPPAPPVGRPDRVSADDRSRQPILDAVIADRSPGVLPPAPRPSAVDRVSIVLPNWNAQAFLARALDSLIARTTYPYQLVIVDNGSTDGSKDYIRAFLRRHPHLDAIFIDNADNLYFSTACNQGFQAAAPENKYLALYCNDVEARSDTWLQDLVEAIQPDDVIAAGQATLKPITPRYRGVYTSYAPVYSDPEIGVRVTRLLEQDQAMHLEGHCFLLKRSLVERTGLYLHTGPFTQYHSDWEWYLRFAAMGFRIAPVALQVHHWHSISELVAYYPDRYRDLLGRLDDPATVERYLSEGRPMYEEESGYRAQYSTPWRRVVERARRRLRRR